MANVTFQYAGANVVNRPDCTLSNPGDPTKNMDVRIRDGGLAGPVVFDNPGRTTSADSVLGDGTGMDAFGAVGPVTLVDGHFYVVTGIPNGAVGVLGYSRGRCYIQTDGTWPANLIVAQVPQAAHLGGVALGVEFVMGGFMVGPNRSIDSGVGSYW